VDSIGKLSNLAVFMHEVLSSVLQFRRADGSIANKADYLEKLINPANTYTKLEVSDIDVQVFENLAQVSLIVEAEGNR
jgi:hypothetical protein